MGIEEPPGACRRVMVKQGFKVSHTLQAIAKTRKGGSNGIRIRLRKTEQQDLAREIGIDI